MGESPVRANAPALTVQVDAASPLGPVKPLVFGINTANWDEQLFPGTFEQWPLTFDQDALRKVKAAGIRFLRYPGGGDGDRYVWNSAINSPLRMDVDEFMLFCKLVGAEPSISVNYPAGPELAASFVEYVNKTKGYGVKYWEIGDEEYFSVPASVYGRKVVEFAKAMKAVDPAIKVGAGVNVAMATWTLEVLRTAGPAIDFVVYNWFPQDPRREDDARLLASPAEFRTNLRALRGFLAQTVPGRAKSIEIHIGGYNSVSAYPGPQTTSIVNALWMADTMGVMLEEGVDAAGFWALHNPYPPRDGDYGILGSTPENRPYPTYHVFALFSRHFGTQLVTARSPDAALSAYASLAADKGSLYVILINKDEKPRTIRLDVGGSEAEGRGRVRLLNERSTPDRLHANVDVTGSFEVPPLSAVSVELPSARAAGRPRGEQLPPGTRLIPAISARASSSAELGPAWAPSSAIDGDERTRWASRIWSDQAEWLELDLGEAQVVSAVRLKWELYATRYRIELSENGSSWAAAYETASGEGGVELVQFTPARARYVRIQMLERPKQRGTAYGHSVWTAGSFSLWEVEALGPAREK